MSEDQKKRLVELCNQKIAELGLGQEYKIRLRNELREVDVQDAYGYFLELHDEGFHSPNENNLIIPYLLGICSEFDINQESAHTIGEFPDIDTDFLPEIRDYLKYKWAPQKFGEDFVAQIGSYNTYKMKMALLDMARIFNQDRNEILKITKNFDSKDDEGEALTWETALELYPNFKEYCEKHPELTDAARRLTGRIRSAGKHASGLMISSTPIKDIVPLMGDDYELTTAWTEGQASSELSAVGLVKFDLLGLKTLQQIVDTMSLIYKRHGIEKLCALPGQPSWSDQSYLDDPELMKMASEGDMTLAFQFGAHGIRHLVKKGKADSFKDIYAYASLYRPGPIGMGMHNVYCDRKNGEPYTVHEKLKFLDETYNVLCIHENALVAMADGSEKPLKEVKVDDDLHSVNLNTKRVESKKCHGVARTRRCDGLELELINGYKVILTPDHEVLTFNGMKRVDELDPKKDFVACPWNMSVDGVEQNIAPWLSDDVRLAYLFGLLVGDAQIKSGITLCTGTKKQHDCIYSYLKDNFSNLNLSETYHTRSWYVGISHPELLNELGYGNRKTKLHKLIEDCDMKHNCYNKVVPDWIFKSSSKIRCAFLAGLFDADGHSSVSWCSFTSESPNLIEGIRRLLQLEGVIHCKYRNRIIVYGVDVLKTKINSILNTKEIKSNISGSTIGVIPFDCIESQFIDSGLSLRKFCRGKNINCRNFYNARKRGFFSTKIATSCQVELGDIRYYQVKSVAPIKDQVFYSIAVADHHNLVANGIVVKNCYQEQIMRVLNIAGGIPLRDCEAVRKAMSKKKIEKFIKYKEMFIKNSQVNLGITEEEAVNLFQQIESFAGYGFNRSHAVAYSVLTMRQMYLKKYFPIEFYTSSLNNVSSRYSGTERDEQLRSAKRITEDHGIRVKPININKSSTDFSIVDEEIYTGFSIIKGIGQEAAERIVANRPYENFDDFLDKFGYENKSVQPILALRMFNDADPVKLYKYFQYRKTKDKKYQESSKRSEASRKKNRLALDNFAALADYKPPLDFYTDDDIEIIASFLPKGEQKLLRRTYASAMRSQINYRVKLRDYKAPCLADFTDEQAAEIEIPKELEELLSDPEKAERHYYGFCWVHPLDKCPRAKDYTFENYNINAYKVGPVEGLIIDVKERQGKVKYHIVTLQDKNWSEEGITVWDNDFQRFKEDLVIGNLVRLQVKPPDEGFTRYTLFSYPPWKPKLIPKKEADFRVVRLKTKSEMTESELEDTLVEV